MPPCGRRGCRLSDYRKKRPHHFHKPIDSSKPRCSTAGRHPSRTHVPFDRRLRAYSDMFRRLSGLLIQTWRGKSGWRRIFRSFESNSGPIYPQRCINCRSKKPGESKRCEVAVHVVRPFPGRIGRFEVLCVRPDHGQVQSGKAQSGAGFRANLTRLQYPRFGVDWQRQMRAPPSP